MGSMWMIFLPSVRMKIMLKNKPVFHTLLFATAITLSIAGVNTLTKYPALRVKNYQIFPYKYSLSVINNSNPGTSYKISPYDDKISFNDGYWRAVITEEEQLTNITAKKLNNWFYRIYQNLLEVANITTTNFRAAGDYKIDYKIAKTEKGFKVIRKIRGIKGEAQILNQALLVSTDNIIFDSTGKLYLNNNEILDLISNLKNSTVCYLAITNPAQPGVLVIPLRKGEQWEVSEKNKAVQISVPITGSELLFESEQEFFVFNTLEEFLNSKDKICY